MIRPLVLALGFLFSVPSFGAMVAEFQHAAVRDVSEIDFGYVRVNDVANRSIRLRNSGTEAMEQLRVSLDSGGAFLVWNYCPRVLQPNQSCYIDLSFQPFSEGSFWGTLFIETVDESKRITLSGWGTY